MNWVLLIGAVWLLVAVLVGVLIGRGIRLADREAAGTRAAQADEPNFVVEPAAPANEATQAPALETDPVPDRVRHPIPSARPLAGRPNVTSSKRMPPSREPGHLLSRLRPR
jgi:hypothetical protein